MWVWPRRFARPTLKRSLPVDIVRGLVYRLSLAVLTGGGGGGGGGRPGKTCHSHAVGWTCGGVVHSFLYSSGTTFRTQKRCQDCLMLTAQSLSGPCLQLVAHSWFFQECATPPHVHPKPMCITRCRYLPAESYGHCHYDSTIPGTSPQ